MYCFNLSEFIRKSADTGIPNHASIGFMNRLHGKNYSDDKNAARAISVSDGYFEWSLFE